MHQLVHASPIEQGDPAVWEALHGAGKVEQSAGNSLFKVIIFKLGARHVLFQLVQVPAEQVAVHGLLK